MDRRERERYLAVLWLSAVVFGTAPQFQTVPEGIDWSVDDDDLDSPVPARLNDGPFHGRGAIALPLPETSVE